jgi:diguanylate cyclase (GGDEF)-like protein/PAS domain S-box-containing protein
MAKINHDWHDIDKTAAKTNFGTARKRAEEALLISERRYRRLFETAQDGIIILDAETGMIMDVNPFLIKMLGYSKEQLVEKAIWEIGSFKDTISNFSNFLELQQNKYIRYENMPLQASDGRMIGVEFVSNVYFVDHQKVIQCNIRDITERSRLEIALAQEKRILETTLKSVGDGVISCDNTGIIVFLNRAAGLLTGWTQETAMGKSITEVFKIINETTRRKKLNIVGSVIKSKEIKEYSNHILLISKDGTEMPVEFSAAPIFEKNEEVTGVVFVFRDFSAKRLRKEEIEFLSYHDQLTGLYNRRFYEEELKRLDTDRNLPMTIAMGDINGLKLINDSFGQMMGDELLKRTAELIKKGCRADDIIARLGGDEFIILLPKTKACEAEKIINRIKNLSEKEKLGSIDVSISFGYETKNDMKEDVNEIFKKTEDNMYRNKLSESMSMRSKTIEIVMNTLFEKNNREMLHSIRVGEICEGIAKKMGLESQAVSDLRTAGVMHDIGKIGIDEKVLNKTQKLSADEWVEIKRHPEIGYRILSATNEFAEIANYVLEHHERWDGNGYPRGMKGEDISLPARIIGLADAYDAMTSKRAYSKILCEEEAINEIKRCSGTQFDPAIVKVFVTGVMEKDWG